MHPGFRRLRATMPGFLNAELTVDQAAAGITNGMAQRRRTVWLPGWIRVLHLLRAFLHSPVAERDMLRAAPEIESLYLEGLTSAGPLASTFGPRERERTLARGVAAETSQDSRGMRQGSIMRTGSEATRCASSVSCTDVTASPCSDERNMERT